jgi:hypothetical protein
MSFPGTESFLEIGQRSFYGAPCNSRPFTQLPLALMAARATGFCCHGSCRESAMAQFFKRIYFMTKARRIKIVFGVLIFLSVVMVSLAIIIRPYLGIFFHDSNFQIFDHVLAADQGSSIFMSLGSVEMVYILLMVISNILWLAGAWYLLSTFKMTDDPAAGKEQ